MGISSSSLIFADDLKMYNLSSRYDILQNDLHLVSKWSQLWQLDISLHKTNVLYLGKQNPKFAYTFSNQNLTESSETKDLGIMVTSDLSCSSQCSYVAKKALRVSNLILRCFQSRNAEMMMKAFLVYVRPILEYATPAWNPWLLKDIRCLENVQKRFSKRIMRNKSLDYPGRLKLFGIESLELRRLYFDLCMVFSIVKSNVLPIEDFFELNTNLTRRMHDWKFVLPKCKSNLRKFDFSIRTVTVWNSLSPDIINCTSTKQFLVKVKKCDLSGYLQGTN